MSNETLYSYTSTTKMVSARKKKQLNMIFDNVFPGISGQPTLLEAGSGRGEFAEIALERKYGYIGIEPSDYLRRDLEKRGIRVLADPLPKIDLPAASIDIVYSFDVVEHLENYETVLGFFAQAEEILKPGGNIVIITPNAETLGQLFYVYEYQHNFFTSIDRLQALLQDAGFEIISSRAFLTELGLSKSKINQFIDRIIASVTLLFARSVFLSNISRAILGRDMVFKIHKNIYDHVLVVARKYD